MAYTEFFKQAMEINESTTPIKAMELAVSLLNFLSNSNKFDRLLQCTAKVDKNGKTRNYCNFVFHHINHSHEDASLDNIVIINRRDHDLLHAGKKSLKDCDIIYFSDYLKPFVNKIKEQTLLDEQEKSNNEK